MALRNSIRTTTAVLAAILALVILRAAPQLDPPPDGGPRPLSPLVLSAARARRRAQLSDPYQPTGRQPPWASAKRDGARLQRGARQTGRLVPAHGLRQTARSVDRRA